MAVFKCTENHGSFLTPTTLRPAWNPSRSHPIKEKTDVSQVNKNYENHRSGAPNTNVETFNCQHVKETNNNDQEKKIKELKLDLKQKNKHVSNLLDEIAKKDVIISDLKRAIWRSRN